jgi:F-type H+-transporting ATPase subunit b
MEKLWSEFSTGLFIWQTIIFLGLLFLLRKYAWKPILGAVEERTNSIEDALSAAEKAKKEMAELSASNEKILTEARLERDALLKDAKDVKDGILKEAKNKAIEEAEKIISSAKQEINTEKRKAMTELKNQVADISIEMAEKIVKAELTDPKKQKELIAKALKETELN